MLCLVNPWAMYELQIKRSKCCLTHNGGLKNMLGSQLVNPSKGMTQEAEKLQAQVPRSLHRNGLAGSPLMSKGMYCKRQRPLPTTASRRHRSGRHKQLPHN